MELCITSTLMAVLLSTRPTVRCTSMVSSRSHKKSVNNYVLPPKNREIEEMIRQITIITLYTPLYLLAVSYTHLRAHETPEHLVCRLLLEKKKNTTPYLYIYRCIFLKYFQLKHIQK
eukprot:TRINITY_DN16788_c0_g1_i2.p2 TRINITY_DN16788_c0_g1~~TRINITY_DN16788_c0_g1_i2.p2  ORF type:complete len:117 (+),score=2.61 TRINITY_DN16788_c0_g1_i2:517-867(+)